MKRILVIDDEEKIRRIYTDFFTSQGYEVFNYSNVVDAHEFLKSKQVDLVLLDINMPEVDGSVFFTLLSTFHLGSKVIVCSVFPLEDQYKAVQGAFGYYDKSQGIEVLSGMVKEVFG